MLRRLAALCAVTLLAPNLAHAQETLGAGRIEVDSALLGGGFLSFPSTGPEPKGYVLDVAVTANASRHLGVEGDFAWAMSRQEVFALNGTSAVDERTPNMLLYTANLVYNPAGKDHRFVPYIELGGGGISVRGEPAVPAFGLRADSTDLMGNLGGGIRWFVIPHWGVRADYRYMFIRNDESSVSLGTAPIHHGQRLYGALVVTW